MKTSLTYFFYILTSHSKLRLIFPLDMSVFPNKVKISLDSRSCKLESFTRPKEISPDSRWSMADSYLVRPKKQQQKTKMTKKITTLYGRMWLGILPDLPLFYQTCLVGSMLLGKTDMCTCITFSHGLQMIMVLLQ